MLANRTFFSFLELTDRTKHQEFNEYHQLDHRPENLALPGVVWGDRWVRTPDCAAASTGTDEVLGGIQYVAMYWFREPLADTITEWVQLGTDAFQWGRRPETDYARRETGFYRPLKGYVNPRVLVSADVVPFRPVRGLHVTCLEVDQPGTDAAEKAFGWYDRVEIPNLVACPGVVGAWTFTTDYVGVGADFPGHRKGLRVHLLYFDEDPLDVLEGIEKRRSSWEGYDLDGVVTERIATPLRPIVPWEWDWFD